MTAKQRNLISLVSYIFFLGLSLLPNMYKVEVWENLESFFGGHVLRNKYSSSFFGTVFSAAAGHQVLGIAVYVACIAAIIMTIIQLTDKGEKQNSKMGVLFSALYAVAYLICSQALFYFSKKTTYGKNSYCPLALYWVQLAAAIMLVAFSVFSYKKIQMSGLEVQGSTEQANVLSAADQLRKYKELLDSGIITDDEYQTKKKQLLNT